MATLHQGNFVSDGETKTISLRSDLDYMRVYNLTVGANSSVTTAVGVEYYWQRGFDPDSGIEYKKSNATNAANLTSVLVSGGFTLLDTSMRTVGAVNPTITSISAASIPVCTNTGDNLLRAGDVVRLSLITGAQQLSGIDFTVGHSSLSATTFSLDYMAQISAGTTASWVRVIYPKPFYPPVLVITKISNAPSARVYTAVAHTLQVGQIIRLRVPALFGLEGRIARVTAVSNSGADTYFDTDVDTSYLPVFNFPLQAAFPFTPPQVVPVGTFGTPVGAVQENKSILGVSLAAGVNSPAGVSGDKIFWVAGKADLIQNEITT
jgi:hypothetical protein